MGKVPNAILTNSPRLKDVKTVADFVAFAKANPGVLNSATQGIGTTSHLTSELFAQKAGVKFQHIHYRGSAPAVQDLVAGNVDVAFDNVGAAGALIKAGTIRALGLATEKPWPSFPGVPTVKDTVPGFVVVTWFALVAPPKVPQPIVDKLNADINEALRDPDVRKRLEICRPRSRRLAGRDRGVLQGRDRDLAQRHQDGERQARAIATFADVIPGQAGPGMTAGLLVAAGAARYEERAAPHADASMSAPADTPADASHALLAHRSFVAYWCARTATNGAYQMQAVAVGWQIYELTGNAFDLGLVGLVQFFPVVVLGLVVGQIADRYDRRVVVGTCQVDQGARRGGLCARHARRLAQPRRDAGDPVRQRHRARIRDADHAHAGARHRAAAAAAARDRGLRHREPDRHHLRAGDRRAALCVRRRHRLSDLHGGVRAGERPGQPDPAARPAAGQEAGHGRGGVRGLSLHPPQPGGARRDLARPVRHAARRRHRAAADLRQGRARDRPVGPGPAALGAGARRARDLDRGSRTTRSSSASAVCCSSRSRRSALATVVFAFSTSLMLSIARARGLRRGRCGQRRDPPFAGADA